MSGELKLRTLRTRCVPDVPDIEPPAAVMALAVVACAVVVGCVAGAPVWLLIGWWWRA